MGLQNAIVVSLWKKVDKPVGILRSLVAARVVFETRRDCRPFFICLCFSPRAFVYVITKDLHTELVKCPCVDPIFSAEKEVDFCKEQEVLEEDELCLPLF